MLLMQTLSFGLAAVW